MIEHFIICGAQRSGTTFLYQILDAHPQVQMAKPARPEPKFFLNEELFKEGISKYEDTFFGKASPSLKARGEKSTSYMEHEIAARRIKEMLPDAKLIFVLRDPVNRAVSNYWFSANNGFETRPIEEAFAIEDQRDFDLEKSGLSASPFNYLGRGKYVEYLDVFREYFSSAQLKICLFEELIARERVYLDLLFFLGLEPLGVWKNDLEQVNASKKQSFDFPVKARKALRDYFEPYNRRLKDEYSVDTDLWTD